MEDSYLDVQYEARYGGPEYGWDDGTEFYPEHEAPEEGFCAGCGREDTECESEAECEAYLDRAAQWAADDRATRRAESGYAQ